MGGTAAAKNEGGGDGPTNTLATTEKGGTYSGGGGGMGGPSGGSYALASGAAGSASPNLGNLANDLLAQFLPKKEDAGPRNGILAFTEPQGRAPAGVPPLLGVRANMFLRIHETYLDKHKRGFIGHVPKGAAPLTRARHDSK